MVAAFTHAIVCLYAASTCSPSRCHVVLSLLSLRGSHQWRINVRLRGQWLCYPARYVVVRYQLLLSGCSTHLPVCSLCCVTSVVKLYYVVSFPSHYTTLRFGRLHFQTLPHCYVDRTHFDLCTALDQSALNMPSASARGTNRPPWYSSARALTMTLCGSHWYGLWFPPTSHTGRILLMRSDSVSWCANTPIRKVAGVVVVLSWLRQLCTATALPVRMKRCLSETASH